MHDNLKIHTDIYEIRVQVLTENQKSTAIELKSWVGMEVGRLHFYSTNDNQRPTQVLFNFTMSEQEAFVILLFFLVTAFVMYTYFYII